jgi:hypothetical protein
MQLTSFEPAPAHAVSTGEAEAQDPYEVRYSAAAARRLRGGVASPAQIAHGVRTLAIRAGLYARSLRARTPEGALDEPGPIADGVTIKRIRRAGGSFFVVRAGFALIACDVLPQERVVRVLVIAAKGELAGRLGIRIHRPNAVPVGPFGWRP